MEREGMREVDEPIVMTRDPVTKELKQEQGGLLASFIATNYPLAQMRSEEWLNRTDEELEEVYLKMLSVRTNLNRYNPQLIQTHPGRLHGEGLCLFVTVGVCIDLNALRMSKNWKSRG